MGITGSRAAVLSNHIDFKIKYQKQWRISNELKEIIKKCRFQKSGGSGKPPERRDVRRPEAEAE